MDVAPWCYKWDWMDWISPGGVRHRVPPQVATSLCGMIKKLSLGLM